jgi:ABC-type lipoprotein export system ATPase subunit
MSLSERSRPHAPAPRQSAIQLRGVTKIYDSEAGRFTALQGVDLEISAGEFVGVVGKSGSGKTTLVNMITAIDRPTSGEVTVGGTAIHELTEGQAAVWRGRKLGVVFQFFQLLPTLTLLQNVTLPMDFLKMLPRRQRRDRALSLLERVGMEAHADKLPSEVSGGQQQRAAIARALANDPPILIADEPTGNLDSSTADVVFQMFVDLAREGKTIVTVTHDNDLARRVDRAVIVADGRVVNQYVSSALNALDLDELSAAVSQFTVLDYAPGSVIIREGDEADRFYIVIRGTVDVVLDHPGGHPILVDTLGPGRYFGEIALLKGTRRTATVRASADGLVEVAALDAAHFRSMIGSSDPTRKDLNRIIAERLAQLEMLR